MIFILIMIGIICLYILPIEITIDFKREKEDDYFKFILGTLFIAKKVEIPYLNLRRFFDFNVEGNIEGKLLGERIDIYKRLNKEEIEEIIDFSQRIMRVINVFIITSFFKQHCSYFFWRTSFGFNNPAYTGILTGSLWSLKGTALGVLHNHFDFGLPPVIEVDSDFNQVKPVEIRFKSIFKFKLGNIIVMGIDLCHSAIKRRLKDAWSSD